MAGNFIYVTILPFGLNFDQGFGGICPKFLGMLIPTLGEDFIDGPLTRLALLTVAQSHGLQVLGSVMVQEVPSVAFSHT